MRDLTNLAASVKARLRNRMRETGESLDHLLTRFAIERLLYRLSRSPHAESFILKGATLFRLWQESPHRPTRDLDLLGCGADEAERIQRIFADLCAVEVAPDGLDFRPESVSVEPIREGSLYHGQRVKLVALLERTRVDLQVDIGFGDAVTPPPEMVDFPVLLDFPAPRLRAYRRETVVAEKLHALVEHGLASGRVKDLVDLWELARRCAFDGQVLAQTVATTFARRGSELPEEPVALTAVFSDSPLQQQLWTAFLRRTEMSAAPPPLANVIDFLRGFLLPLVTAARRGEGLAAAWPPGGPWR
ncbi:MAG: nucleotidyl transferase AbiEii/AbiGii toxin family protein [Fimbriimonadaceae bacterium]|nr:nucleotidyl transferase AbiEii/AbiGii toxin family protein [Fimbriimonadaceae bacterium]